MNNKPTLVSIDWSDMQNVRAFVDESQINRGIHSTAGIMTNGKYRQYLQSQAEPIMRANTNAAIQASGNNPYIITNRIAAAPTPFRFSSCHDTRIPPFGYCNSDLKRAYMEKTQMACRKVSPQIKLPQSF